MHLIIFVNNAMRQAHGFVDNQYSILLKMVMLLPSGHLHLSRWKWFIYLQMRVFSISTYSLLFLYCACVACMLRSHLHEHLSDDTSPSGCGSLSAKHQCRTHQNSPVWDAHLTQGATPSSHAFCFLCFDL